VNGTVELNGLTVLVVAADAYVFAVLSKPFEVHRMLHLVARASRGDK
jgi:hypothetical protein